MGHIVNVELSHDQGGLLNRVSMSMYTIAVAFVALRYFTRGYIVKKFGLDDLFIAFAVTLGGAQTVTHILQVENGSGRHASMLHVEEFNNMLMYRWLNMLIYFVANWCVKMSILALYYRIGYGRQGLPWIVQPRSVLITAGIMTAFSLSVSIAQFCFCTPISNTWSIEDIPDGCIDGQLFMMLSAAINVATDLILLLFPLPLLPLFKYNRRQRMALAVILSIGLIPVVASTMRLCEIVMSDAPVIIGRSWQEADWSWGWAWVPVWSQIEIDIGILAASLPCLSPLLQRICSGFHCPTRGSTPSQMPTVPGYRESWAIEKQKIEVDVESGKSSYDAEWRDEKASAPEGSADTPFDVEKALNVREVEMSYFNDSLSDIEEEGEVDLEKNSGEERRGSRLDRKRLSVLDGERMSVLDGERLSVFDTERLSVGVAQTVDMRVVVGAGVPKVVDYTKL